MLARKRVDCFFTPLALALAVGVSASAGAQTDKPKIEEGIRSRPADETSRLRETLGDTGLGKHWIYDDLATALTQAKKSGKPLLAVFR